ncbi:hypothetical protein DICVIV_03022 [Dictyocaulus viviparus]|uniref:WH2 domain-containing protein n=1 Tax=Dictyocaulus viviparus TaxID=29172 RepID=A0A0D8Y3N3_DICVI|nr:hypothetical protein DICVIV_03022 [Dictyocaulus viviparus]
MGSVAVAQHFEMLYRAFREIRQGFKLRPTKTVDKSKPVILAEGEDADCITLTKRPPSASTLQSDKATEPLIVEETPKFSSSPQVSLQQKSVLTSQPLLPINVLPSALRSPSPVARLPHETNRKSPSPLLTNLGGKSPAEIDLGELLHSIQGGVRLRKTVTNDKSGLIVDDTMRQKSVQLIEPAPSTAFVPHKKEPLKKGYQRPHSPRDLTYLNSLGDASEDERFLTPTGRGSEYATPEPDTDGSSRDSRNSPVKEERRPTDFAFTEKSLKITKEDIEQEIPSGTAAARIAAFMQNVGAEVSNGGTVPRNFRPSPLKIPKSSEVNNNAGCTNKTKAPSKWAPVETGGLRQPTRVNVPMDRNERAHSEVRCRSKSNLQEPNIERARTQSPISRDVANVDLPTSEERRSLFKEIGMKTDCPPPLPATQPPSINEIPPTPKTSKASGCPYNTVDGIPSKKNSSRATSKSSLSQSLRSDPSCTSGKVLLSQNSSRKRTDGSNESSLRTTQKASPVRNKSPARIEVEVSPTPSQSSTSIPSPSSISPASTSPNATRKRNPAFDKAKEKFSGCFDFASPPLSKDRIRRSVSPLTSFNATKEKFENKQKKMINVPISAPWYQPSLSRTTASEMSRSHKVVVSMDPFSSLDPGTFRRSYRFNIDLSSDSPLSIVER